MFNLLNLEKVREVTLIGSGFFLSTISELTPYLSFAIAVLTLIYLGFRLRLSYLSIIEKKNIIKNQGNE